MLQEYNLLRSQMVKMAASLKGYTASQLSFHMASVYLIHELSCMPYMSPGNIPKRVADLERQAGRLYCRNEGREVIPLREAKVTEVQC